MISFSLKRGLEKGIDAFEFKVDYCVCEACFLTSTPFPSISKLSQVSNYLEGKVNT